MNAVERVLNDEVSRLLDRLAASVPGGCLETVGSDAPMRRRLDEVETQMAAVRASVLEGYGHWRRVLEDLENLWALAAWRTTSEPSAPEQAVEQTASLAA